MRVFIILIVCFLASGCNESTTSKPIYSLGERVVVSGSLHGVVIDHRNWIGASRRPTSDYYVVIDGVGAATWYDEEVLKKE